MTILDPGFLGWLIAMWASGTLAAFYLGASLHGRATVGPLLAAAYCAVVLFATSMLVVPYAVILLGSIPVGAGYVFARLRTPPSTQHENGPHSQ